MSGKKENSVQNVEEDELRSDDLKLLISSALSEGDSTSLINFVCAHGLSHCGFSYGGYALLRDAIKSDQYDFAKFLLLEGTKVDFKTDRVNELLHYATEKGWAELVSLLLERNTPVDARNGQSETPLHLAVKKGFSNIVKVLLNNNASLTAQTNEGSTPLLLAVENRCEEIVEIILKHAHANSKDGKNNPAKNQSSTILDRILLCSPSACEKVNKLVVHIVTQNERSKIVNDLIDHGFTLNREYVRRPLLVAAIRRNWTRLIENILLSGFDLGDAKYTPLLLQTAVMFGHTEIVEFFLNLGLDVNAQNVLGKTPISYVLKCRNEDKCAEILQLLLASGADLRKTPELLHKAVEKGLYKVCKVLVESGASLDALDRHGNTPLHVAIRCQEDSNDCNKKQKRKKLIDEAFTDKIIKLFLNAGFDVNVAAKYVLAIGLTAFHQAVENGRKDAVCSFLDYGVDVNLHSDDNVTPLHLAALGGYEDILELLLANNANVHACLESNGATPLHLAAKNGHSEIVATLCEKGANMDAHQSNDGWTPLFLAAIDQHTEVLKMLLNNGANVNAQGLTNETALHCVVGNPYNTKAALFLLENGSDVNAKTQPGETALDIAIAEARVVFAINGPQNRQCIDYGFHTAFNYMPDSDEPGFVPDKFPTIKVLKQHLVKLKVAGLFVNERNLYLLDKTTAKDSGGSSGMSDFERKTEEELTRMKKTQLSPEFSLYDILVISCSNNPGYAKNESLVETLQSFNWKKFPIYGSLIRNNFKRHMLKLEMVGSGCKSLDILVKTSTKLNGTKVSILFEELLEQIVLYLNNFELKRLIRCGEALKRQLTH